MLGDDSQIMEGYYEETKGTDLSTLPPITDSEESDLNTESVMDSQIDHDAKNDDENNKLRSEQLQFSIILAVCT